MIWIVGAVIGLVVFAIWAVTVFADTIFGKVINYLWAVPLSALLGAFLGLGLAILAGMAGTAFIPTQEVKISETPIYSVVDRTKSDGHFVLGTGYANSDLCVYYVTETDEGRKIESAKRANVVIVESDTEEPKAVVTGQRYKSSWGWLKIFFLDVNGIFTGDKVTLTVPEGTITQEYTVDLQ